MGLQEFPAVLLLATDQTHPDILHPDADGLRDLEGAGAHEVSLILAVSALVWQDQDLPSFLHLALHQGNNFAAAILIVLFLFLLPSLLVQLNQIVDAHVDIVFPQQCILTFEGTVETDVLHLLQPVGMPAGMTRVDHCLDIDCKLRQHKWRDNSYWHFKMVVDRDPLLPVL